MKFIINTTNLQSGGALQVALSLIEEWNNNEINHEFHVLLSPQLSAILQADKYNSNFKFYYFNTNPTSNIWNILFFKLKLNSIEQKLSPDAVFSVFGPVLWKPNAAHLVGFANGIFLFDDAEYIRNRIKPNLLARLSYYLRRNLLFKQLKKEGNYYWVETIKAQKKLASTLKIETKKITVVGNTFSQFFSEKKTLEANTKKPFRLLFVSAYYPHKNFEIIPKVIEILKDRNVACQFAFTLDDTKFQQIFNTKEANKYLLNLGPSKPSVLQEIYEQADAVFMPSLLETYSANYPEAMKMRKPILCSDLDFAHHICGASALYFNPNNAENIASKIQTLMQDKDLQKQLIEAGAERLKTMETPASRADKLLQILENLSK